MGDRNKLISIDIGNHSIKCAQCILKKDKVIIKKAFVTDTPEGSVEDGKILEVKAVVAAIAEALKKGKIKGKHVRFCVNSPMIITREILLPIVKKAKLEAMIFNNLSDYFPIDVTNYSVAHHFLGVVTSEEEGIKKEKVLLVATPTRLIDEYQMLATALHLEIVGLDYREDSVYQYIKLQKVASVNLWLCLGTNATTIGVVDNGQNELMKTIPYGISNFVEALMNQYDISNEEARNKLFTEGILEKQYGTTNEGTDEFLNVLHYVLNSLGTYIKYYTSKKDSKPIETAIIIGEGSRILGFGKHVEEALSLETYERPEGFNIIYKKSVAQAAKTMHLEFVIGTALSKIDLRPTYKKNNVTSLRIFFVILLIFALISSAAAAYLVPAYQMKKLEGQKSDLQQKLSVLEPINNKKKELDTIKKQYDNRLNLLAMADTNTNHLSELFGLLEKSIPSGIDIVNFSSDDAGITMNCTALDRMTVADFIYELKQISNLTNIFVGNIIETTNAEGNKTLIQFPITCSYKEVVTE